jgi:hypothetical protein
MEIEINEQQKELLHTLLQPIAEDDNNSNFTRLVAAQLLDKLEKENEV